ncbi:hypothetical protein NCCP2222_32910 [Sporosarcina sp. NCCP-2222]|uniref:hypothetical protein n=1 Tax=Sporosarcina sp. NCCP-2222 TaxID=2935073 RepID=UPI0020885B1D|nr:hypothetical protein [Sporosarcina sp. NCCP-2222]GKV57344.1 hypothetical protein NCCP2222_32910 [Sporosarcina sp. NCCP-2222]
MKKLLMVLLMALLVMALAACGDDKKDEGQAAGTNDTDNTEQAEGTTDDAEGTEDASTDAVEDEYFQNVIAILKDAGYDVTDIKENYDNSFFVDTISSVAAVINGEDVLQFQAYEIDPDSESLKQAQETGLAPAEFEGQKFDYEGIIVIGNHYFFLAEGHPDQADIYKLLEEKLK